MSLSRRKFVVQAAAGTAAASSALFSTVSRAAAAKEFRLGLITPAGHSWNRAAVGFGEALKKATDGRLSATVFHSGQLGNESA
jgi:TRAP-type transport system periplasmic protein